MYNLGTMQKQGNLGWFWLMSDCHWHIPCNQNTTVVPAWYLSRFSACHATQLGQMAKIRQKINSKNMWNWQDWLTRLMPAAVWREDDLKIIPLPETEILNVALENSWNHIKHNDVDLFLVGFSYSEPLCAIVLCRVHSI